MLTVVSSADIALEEGNWRENSYGVRMRITDFVGKCFDADGNGPQGFLTEVPAPYAVLRPHFHRVEGFHVVTDGELRLYDETLPPVAIHYTDANTPYGPMGAGPEGMSLFEFRPRHTLAAFYMPGSEHELPNATPGRQI